MGKLTPTFKDHFEDNGSPPPPMNSQKNGGTHIIPPHEPLPGEPLPTETGAGVFAGIPPTALGVAKDIPTENKEPAPLKVALIGTAPSSRMLAPFNDPSWQIWACSPGNQGQLPRVDVWFELHGNLLWPENIGYGAPYIEWLKTLTIPVYMQSREWVPNATPFPMKDMVDKFGPDFFTSSFAWMMAMAIDRGAKEIALFGIDMASRDEYILQRPGFYYFKYRAEQAGIKVWAPNESDIMQSPGLYGFSEVTPFGRKVLTRKKELQDRVNAAKQQIAQLQHTVTYLDGALEDIDYVAQIWGGVQHKGA
jgi:hypothetical protein